MYETSDELATLQLLLDSSHTGASEHLRGIIHDGRTLRATEVGGLLTGMHTLAAGTVTRTGEPHVSALDGHFLHGRWTISTSATSPKGRHLRARPGVSSKAGWPSVRISTWPWVKTARSSPSMQATLDGALRVVSTVVGRHDRHAGRPDVDGRLCR